ncbi:MAG: class I SAM-dependent methyltransferase [Verrucomicrobia bacterium]|nr:class I SAM-dependent methyltransferase [Verrucomicrobiota bacterium]
MIEQYNPIAETYSDIFLQYNLESIEAYYRHLGTNLSGKKVLDIGCGDGYDLWKMGQLGAILSGIDASDEMVKLASIRNPEAQIKVGHFDAIPFADNSFDIIVSKWALQTADLIDPIYKEIIRVLKPGGMFICLTSHPIRQFIEKKKYGKDYFKKELVESTFFDGAVTVIEPSHTLNEYLSPLFFERFTLQAFEEGFDSGAEKVNGDIYPSYFLIKATLNKPH